MNLRRLFSLAARGSLPCGSWLLLALCACGSNAVDVGAVPEQADAAPPDLTASPDNLTAGCSMPGLRDYRVIFDSDGGGLERRIYSMRADGTELEALTPVDELAREPALSPDGSQLAYTTPEGVKLLSMASRESQLLVPSADHPAWSPDGTLISYRSVEGFGATTLFIRHMSDGTDEPTISCYGNGCSSSEFTPDGTALVYTEEVYREDIVIESRVTALALGTYIMRQVVPQTAIRMEHPTISGDGVWLATSFECAGSLVSSLWASPFAVLTPPCEGHRITAAGAPAATNPKWGPGTFIAYERGEPPRDIAIVQADTGEECVIPGPGDDRNPSWGLPIVPIPE